MPTDKNITRIIDTSSYKPFNNESIENEELIYKLDLMWTHIEDNFDKKIEKIIVIGSDAQVFISTPLDITQFERLKDHFYILDDIENLKGFDLFTLNV